jgi:hypothetical protein
MQSYETMTSNKNLFLSFHSLFSTLFGTLIKKKKKSGYFCTFKGKKKKKVSKGEGNVDSHLCTRESTSPTKGGWRESRLQPDRVIFQEC